MVARKTRNTFEVLLLDYLCRGNFNNTKQPVMTLEQTISWCVFMTCDPDMTKDILLYIYIIVNNNAWFFCDFFASIEFFKFHSLNENDLDFGCLGRFIFLIYSL